MDVRVFYVQYSTVLTPTHVHKCRLFTNPADDNVGEGLDLDLDLDLP